MCSRTFHVINFGCRATQADGAALEQAFLRQNYQRAELWKYSDVVVINTCTVTHTADAEARATIRRVHRENPSAQIVVTGCYAQREPRELATIKGVSCVVGNSHKDQLVSIVTRQVKGQTHIAELPEDQRTSTSDASIYCSSIFESRALRIIGDPGGGLRTRAVLKIQDGCSYRCSYCVIPFVRGDSRSLPPPEVLRQTRLLLDHGYREITLTGIHLGGYGRDFGEKGGLAQLIKLLLLEDRLRRLRLSSIEPLEYTDDLIDIVASSAKMAKHFHVPLQSGSDRVLRLMRRPYTAEFYTKLVEKMRQRVPEAAIGADVMVGFPTETEVDHRKTMALLDNVPITYLHVFPYSHRPGTPADMMRPVVNPVVVNERSFQLRHLAVRKNQEFREKFIDRRMVVITLRSEGEENRIGALSSNYLKVDLSASGLQPNQLLEVVVTGTTVTGLSARTIS